MLSKGLLPVVVILLLLTIFSCASSIPAIGEDWNEEMFFKSAQESIDVNNLEQALFYYDVYQLRYPSNLQKGIAADYEIAYIYYKWEDYETSLELFNKLLQRYESDPMAYLYPPAYMILAEKVIERIEQLIEIESLPFYQRGKAYREFLGTDRDETITEEI